MSIVNNPKFICDLCKYEVITDHGFGIAGTQGDIRYTPVLQDTITHICKSCVSYIQNEISNDL